MKTRPSILIAALLLLAMDARLSTAVAQGSLTPPGPPAPTMVSLDQIYSKLDPRAPITNSGAVTISAPGSYYLTTNITVGSGVAITIATNNVTLDLAGFTISSTKPSAGGSGILLSGGRTNIAIHNGMISSGVTNNAGVYAGSGFANGIFFSGVSNFNVRVSDVSVIGCLNDGIYLETSAVGVNNSTIVESCTVQTVGGNGIQASGVYRSTANLCGAVAIIADDVSDSFGYNTGSGDGITAYRTANNCYGYTTGAGSGVDATTANNCYGYSVYTGTSFSAGVAATTVNNCYGYSAGGFGYGVNASTANNCYGDNNGNGVGLYASTAINCAGFNTLAGYGLEVGAVAIGCRGSSPSGTGLVAYLANSCVGISTGGLYESVTNKYNMP